VPLSAGLCCFSSPPATPGHVTHIGPATVHACVRITHSKQNRYNSKTPQVRLRFMFHYRYAVSARSHLQPIRLHAQPFQGWSVIVNPMRSMEAF